MDLELIKELRNTFIQELSSKGEDTIHPKDLDRIKIDDNWLNRFLLHNDNKMKESLQMMWDSVIWRKEFQTNDISDLVKKDVLVQGGFFPHGYDKDGCSLFIFKCKKYVKGAQNSDDLKRCVVYWFERLERQDKGKPITVFFDMEGCGLANMDLEFTKYLIGLFKLYYPFFLNYILIFEMPWILNAAFKIIKTWLPEKAIQKIKFVSKKDVKEFVPADQALVCWGGLNEYVYSFLPENTLHTSTSTPIVPNKKVHFSDGSPISESPDGSGDKENDGGDPLKVQPSGIITFTKDGTELVSSLELQNTDKSIILSFKLKTTSPEKFRVRPSVGCLTPGAKVTIHVTLLPGFQLGGLSRDKFLVMSTQIDANDISSDLATLWKDTSNRTVNQHRLKCAQLEQTKNGNAVMVSGGAASSGDGYNEIILKKIGIFSDCQSELHNTVKNLQNYQMITSVLLFVVVVLLFYLIYEVKRTASVSSCMAP